MCPLCFAGLAMIIGATASTGELTPLAVKDLRFAVFCDFLHPSAVFRRKHRTLLGITDDRWSTTGRDVTCGSSAGNRAVGARLVFVHQFAHLWETSLPYAQVFHPEDRAPVSPYPAYWQEIAWTARLWLLNCESQDCGLPGKRTVRAYGRHPLGIPRPPSSPPTRTCTATSTHCAIRC